MENDVTMTDGGIFMRVYTILEEKAMVMFKIKIQVDLMMN